MFNKLCIFRYDVGRICAIWILEIISLAIATDYDIIKARTAAVVVRECVLTLVTPARRTHVRTETTLINERKKRARALNRPRTRLSYMDKSP